MHPMTVGICNKCGEARALVLASSVCGCCIEALDSKWAGSGVTDWVLMNHAPDVLEQLKASLPAKSSGVKEPSVSSEALPRYLFRNTTYEQMKSHWAIDDVTGSFMLRPIKAADEVGHLPESQYDFGWYMHESIVLVQYEGTQWPISPIRISQT
jgi:hypothetical protein